MLTSINLWVGQSIQRLNGVLDAQGIPYPRVAWTNQGCYALTLSGDPLQCHLFCGRWVPDMEQGLYYLVDGEWVHENDYNLEYEEVRKRPVELDDE